MSREKKAVKKPKIKKKTDYYDYSLLAVIILLTCFGLVMLYSTSSYMAELNYIHPIREGNGRAIREFMRLQLLPSGYVVQWDAVDVEALLNAMIDSVYDTAHLEQILKQCLVAAPDSR